MIGCWAPKTSRMITGTFRPPRSLRFTSPTPWFTTVTWVTLRRACLCYEGLPALLRQAGAPVARHTGRATYLSQSRTIPSFALPLHWGPPLKYIWRTRASCNGFEAKKNGIAATLRLNLSRRFRERSDATSRMALQADLPHCLLARGAVFRCRGAPPARLEACPKGASHRQN